MALTFDLKVNRAHLWLMGSVPVKFYENRCKGEAVMRMKPFNLTFELWPWPLTPKSTGPILDSWGMCLWSFMRMGVKGKQLCTWNNFTLPMHCDLDLWPFDPKVDRAHPLLMGSVPVKFHEDGCKGEAVMPMKPFFLTHALWPWPLTSRSTGPIFDSWGVCLWSFMRISVKEKQLCACNHFT